MSVIIAILLWLGAITPGTYTQEQFDAINNANAAQVTAVQNDPVALNIATTTENPSVVTVGNIFERD